MQVSQKCQYAIRAIYQLAGEYGSGPQTAAHIAEAQSIPLRFLEQILRQLRQAGMVVSRRGAAGGYLLAVPPDDLSVGEVVRVIEGPIQPVRCVSTAGRACDFRAGCAFAGLWRRTAEAVRSVYEETTFQRLLAEDTSAGKAESPLEPTSADSAG